MTNRTAVELVEAAYSRGFQEDFLVDDPSIHADAQTLDAVVASVDDAGRRLADALVSEKLLYGDNEKLRARVAELEALIAEEDAWPRKVLDARDDIEREYARVFATELERALGNWDPDPTKDYDELPMKHWFQEVRHLHLSLEKLRARNAVLEAFKREVHAAYNDCQDPDEGTHDVIAFADGALAALEKVLGEKP